MSMVLNKESKKMESYNIPVEEVANYFLDKLDAETEDCISNLKLQKLVYYAQGFVMAFKDKKLFNDEIKAWEHGPVIERLYYKYRENGSRPITRPDNIEFTELSKHEDLMYILDEVYKVYGQYSAWRLRDMTHNETPWLETPRNQTISDKLMLAFFKTQINYEKI